MKPDVFLKIPEAGFSVEWLAGALELEPEEILALFELGAVYADGERVFSSEALKHGQTLRVFPSPLRFPAHLLTEKNILFESDNFVAVDKPAGLPSVPVASNAFENALERTRQLTGFELFPVHRLDEATRGVLLMARSAEAVHGFQKLQRAGKVLKLYQALTRSEVPLGLHEHWMAKGSGRMEIVERGDNTYKLAKLKVLSSVEQDGHWLSTIQLLTGRTHQIRCQLAHLGCPIVGDTLYGTAKSGDLQLLAWKLEFDGKEIISPQSLTTNKP